jgi:hypothetical protein
MTLKFAIAEARSFEDLRPIVDNIDTGISILGDRYIVAEGYNGIVSIDALAARVIELVNQYQFNFTRSERSHGKSIANRITQMYNQSDAQVNQQNFLIRFFVSLRNLRNLLTLSYISEGRNCSLTRWYWKECNDNFVPGYQIVFDSYPRNRYNFLWHVCRFGLTPDESHRFKHPEPEKRNEKVNCWW